MIYVTYGLAYFAYAFIQASIQMRLGHSMSEDRYDNPIGDMVGFMLFAPLITVFWILYAILAVPFKMFGAYATKLREASMDHY